MVVGRIGRRVGAAALGGTLIGGAALGWGVRRRALSGQRAAGHAEWAALRRAVDAEARTVRSFDGTALHVEVSGPPDAPPLVFAHGYALSLESWQYQRRDLSDEFRVIAYDHRGHGRSAQAGAGDYTMETLGRDLAAVVDATAPHGRVVLVGHSTGGMMVMSWAGQHPGAARDRLAGAVLVGTTAAGMLAGTTLIGGRERLAEAVGMLAPRAVAFSGPGADRPTDFSFLLVKAFGLGPDASPAHVAMTEQMVLSCPVKVRAALLPAVTGVALDDALSALTAPTLVVVGEHDRLTPPAQARRLVEALPDGRLLELSGVGHMAPLEAHEALTAHLRRFAREALGREAA